MCAWNRYFGLRCELPVFQRSKLDSRIPAGSKQGTYEEVFDLRSMIPHSQVASETFWAHINGIFAPQKLSEISKHYRLRITALIT